MFSTQLDADYLNVYDGDSSFSPLIDTFSGTTLPAPIISSSNKLHVRFTTDSSGTARGFRAGYRGRLAPRGDKKSNDMANNVKGKIINMTQGWDKEKNPISPRESNP